jgi:hypothetical protein
MSGLGSALLHKSRQVLRRIVWRVTIARGDGSTLRCTEHSDRAPIIGEAFKVTDADGKTLDLLVESVTREPNHTGGPENYRLTAKERCPMPEKSISARREKHWPTLQPKRLGARNGKGRG